MIQKQIACPHCKGTGADNPNDVVKCLRVVSVRPWIFQSVHKKCIHFGTLNNWIIRFVESQNSGRIDSTSHAVFAYSWSRNDNEDGDNLRHRTL